QQKITPTARDVAEFLQREQAASCRGGRNAGTARDVTEAQGRMIPREGADHGESLCESAHRLTTHRRFPTPCHARSLFRYPKGRKGLRSSLDDGPRASPLLFRISTQYSVCERCLRGQMKIGRQDQRSSAISTSNEETILVRGRDLARELIGRITFTEHFWLLVTGSLPTPGQLRVLDAALVAIAEHGLVPSVQVSRMTLAAAPEALQGAVAAGILGCGSVVLGSSEAAGRFLAEIRAGAAPRASLELAAAAVVREYREAKRAIPGYGHPLHSGGDPRASRLLEVAAETGIAGRYVEIARLVEQLLPGLIARPLPLNVSGAIPAVL